LIHWGDSELTEMLRRPELNGILQFFFGIFQPRPEWFAAQVTGQLANLGDKYIPQLHTATGIDFQLHTLLGDTEFVREANKQAFALGNGVSELKSLAQKVRAAVAEDFKLELTNAADSLDKFLLALSPIMKSCREFSIAPLKPRQSELSTSLAKSLSELESLWRSLAVNW